MNRHIVVLSIIGLFIIACSCQKGSPTLEVNCADCLPTEPDSSDISVDLTIDNVYDSVYLKVFLGKVESGKLIWECEVNEPHVLLTVPVNEYYSVKAYYRRNGSTVIAIDGDKMVSRFISDACDGNCWIVKGGLLNVEMKY